MLGGLTARVVGMIGGGVILILTLALIYITLTKNAEIRSLNKNVTRLEARVGQLTSDLATCTGNTARLNQAIDAQNRSLADLADRAAVGARQAAVMRAELAKAKINNDAKLARIAKASAGADQCASTDALILENAR